MISRVVKTLQGEGYPVSTIDGAPPRSRLSRIDRTSPSVAWKALNEKLSAAATNFGFKPDDVVTIDLLARAGQVVLFPSAKVDDVLECYASIVSQGAYLVQSLDPSVIGYDDLWRSPAGDKPTPLSRAWSACIRDKSTFQLVHVEGIERTPLDLWIEPFIRTLSSSGRPENLLIFMSIGGRPIATDRAYPDLSQLLVPFDPEKSPGPTADLMQRLTGYSQEKLWLDAAARPKPTTSEASAILSSASKAPPSKLAFAVRAYAASHCVEIGNVDGMIQLICQSLDTSQTDEDSSFAAGRKYLRTLID